MVFQVLKKKFEENERVVFLIALTAGFIFDSFTLVRIDGSRDHLILGSYLFIALVGIFFVNLAENKMSSERLAKLSPWFLFAMQFAFGGLFSNFVVLYSRSATFLTSWPFLLLLVGLLIGNEFFKKHYDRLILQLSIFFLTIFSFLIFFVPIVIGKMGDSIFLLSGAISLFVIFCIVCILSKFISEKIRKQQVRLFCAIGVLFILINTLYFTNIIPPIPLSLKDAEVYHSVMRDSKAGYVVTSEVEVDPSMFLGLYPREKVLHIRRGDPLYVWSSVFAPTKLSTSIVHQWNYFDENKKVWTSSIRVEFSIVGGRDEGYRGYSYREDMIEGLWRVDIETPTGQIIGSEKFRVETVSNIPTLSTKTR